MDFYLGKGGQTLLSYHQGKKEFELHKGDPNFQVFSVLKTESLSV